MNKKNFPIFLTGSTGLFGKNFLKINKKIKNKILYPNKKSLNITKKKETISFLNKTEFLFVFIVLINLIKVLFLFSCFEVLSSIDCFLAMAIP